MKSQNRVIIKTLINMIKSFQVLEELQVKLDQETKQLIIQEEIAEGTASKINSQAVEQMEEKTTLVDLIDHITIAKEDKVVALLTMPQSMEEQQTTWTMAILKMMTQSVITKFLNLPRTEVGLKEFQTVEDNNVTTSSNNNNQL